MANVKKIEDGELLVKLSAVFKDYGYEGASLAILSDATGLKKPSLYHRFPRGKEQMAEEVLSFTYAWIEKNILQPLKTPASPEKKIALFATQIGKLYNNGKDACLLNVLSTTKAVDNPFASAIHSTFETLKTALSEIAMEKNIDRKEAEIRAERVLIEIQGALVLSRGTGATAPFKRILQNLPKTLLGV